MSHTRSTRSRHDDVTAANPSLSSLQPPSYRGFLHFCFDWTAVGSVFLPLARLLAFSNVSGLFNQLAMPPTSNSVRQQAMTMATPTYVHFYFSLSTAPSTNSVELRGKFTNFIRFVAVKTHRHQIVTKQKQEKNWEPMSELSRTRLQRMWEEAWKA